MGTIDRDNIRTSKPATQSRTRKRRLLGALKPVKGEVDHEAELSREFMARFPNREPPLPNEPRSAGCPSTR